MTPETRRARGMSARALLEDETIAAVLAEVRADIHAAWERARFSRTRDALHAEIRALDRVTGKLANWAGQAPR